MNYRTLISTSELANQLTNAELAIFDCRHDLAKPDVGYLAYRESHIPDARFVHLDRDLSGPTTGKNGRHPLPDPEAFAKKLGTLGVDNSTQVVAYDGAGGMYAARLWWMLRWLNHDRVCVLDGGWQKWLAENRVVSRDQPEIKPKTFSGTPKDSSVDVGFIEAHLGDQNIRIIDARSAERFRGIGETLDRVGGHIPGAKNRFFKDNLDSNSCFRPAAELKHAFSELIDSTLIENVIHQCGSGVTACHNLLAMEIAGLSGAKLYPGSWSEWCSDSARPVET